MIFPQTYQETEYPSYGMFLNDVGYVFLYSSVRDFGLIKATCITTLLRRGWKCLVGTDGGLIRLSAKRVLTQLWAITAARYA